MSRGHRERRGLHGRYVDAAVAGDTAGAHALIDRARARGWSAVRIHLELLGPAQEEIGARWQAGRLGVAEEHLATEITLWQMERLRGDLRGVPALGTRAVVCAVEGEHHAVGPRMFSDFLLMDGWAVDFLGANTPTADLVEFVRQRRPDLVGLSITMAAHLDAAARAVRALRQLPRPPKILVGGRAARARAAAIRADGVAPEALAGVREARRLIEKPRPATPVDPFEALGRRVQEARQRRGWTQQGLADAAGLDRTYISGLEHGKQNPTLGALMRLAQALELPLEQLIILRRGDA